MLNNIQRIIIIFAALFLLGCAGTPQSEKLAKTQLTDVKPRGYIENVPFYPQQEYYCGPTTLSEVFNFYGQSIQPEEIAPKLFIPEQQGSFQTEMLSATRQYGLLPYSDTGTLETLVQLLDDGIPVIIFQNLSISWFPQWHYALVTGYDLVEQEFRLHTGKTANYSMSFELLERTWRRGSFWYMVVLTEQQRSKTLDSFLYTQSAYNMLTTGVEAEGIGYLQVATQVWPDQWLAYFLLANHYLENNPVQAIEWFNKGYHAGKYESAYLNNFANAFINAQCINQAANVIKFAEQQFPDADFIQVTRNKLNELKNVDSNHCPL